MNSAIVIRGRTVNECEEMREHLSLAGKDLHGAYRVAFTAGAGPFVLVVECLPEKT